MSDAQTDKVAKAKAAVLSAEVNIGKADANIEKARAVLAQKQEANRRKQVLENFPLDSLDMIGTLGKGGSQIGLVMVPEKVTYRVRPGDYMGQSDGRVTGVFEDRIELVELVPDGAGGWLERPATVSLDDE